MRAYQHDLPDFRMHVHATGAGAPVVFVHGFPFDGRLWSEQLEALAPTRRWIAPDLRGFGLSEPGPDTEPLTMDLLADDLVTLLDAEGLERAAFCGVSMGGYILLALWRRHPERVAALCLCDTRAEPDTEEARRARMELAERVREEGAGAAARAMVRRVLAERTRKERTDVVDHVRSMIEATRPATIVRGLHGMAERPDSTALLPTVSVPTLVLAGEHDAITPPADVEAMARAIPGAHYQTLDGAGHLPMLERPTDFNRLLVDFLDDAGA